MKRIHLFFFFLILCIASAFGQGMDWLCHPGEYADIRYSGGGLFKVRTAEGKYGLIGPDGQPRIAAVYDSITPFVEQRALLLDRAGKRLLGIIDTQGEMVKDFSTEAIFVTRYPYFKEGRLAFYGRNGLHGYMNQSGQTVIEPQYYMAAPFQDGVATIQYQTTDFGLINKGGRSVIVSDTHYPFISSPVDGCVLVIRSSRKGANQLAIMRIDGSKLKKEKILEDGMNIWLADDFTSIECQNPHTYHIDDQWRVLTSNYNAKLPQPKEETTVAAVDDSTVLSKVSTENGYKITYLGNPIMDFPFDDVSTFDTAYAIVRSKEGRVGALKLNPSAKIIIFPNEEPMTFHHNELKDILLDVRLTDVDPAKIKWYRNDQGWLTHSRLEQVGGEWKLRMPYFKSADEYDREAVETVDIAITYDGLDWIHQYVDVRSLHKPGYDVTLTGSDVTPESGNATLTLSVNPAGGGSGKAFLSINGGKPVGVTGGKTTMPLSVSVPEGKSKSFVYDVVITEEGCPQFSTRVSKNISNPVRKPKPPVNNERKEKKEKKEKKEENRITLQL